MVGDNLLLKEKQAELTRLKEEFLDLFKKHEDLCKENFVIYNRYNLTFGQKFYERYLLYCENERLRRKIEMYQAYLNRGERIDKGFVETMLDAELRENELRLETLLQEYQNAQEFEKLPVLSPEEDDEIDRIYLKIAKRIHPALHPDFAETQKDLWLKATNAYGSNDLEALQACEVIVDGLGEEAPPEDDKMDAEIENIKKKNEELKNQNLAIIRSFPYNQKELLSDSEWVQDKLDEIENDIKLFRESMEFLKGKLKEIDPTYEKEIC